ncbi:MAG: nitrate reductase associated protein [Bacteroidota bacterium]
MKGTLSPSEFRTLKGIEYFDFEEDFIEENVRCIPMIVRFKLDATGIKLKLNEWSKFSAADRITLALMPAEKPIEVNRYFNFLTALIEDVTKGKATPLAIDNKPAWGNLEEVPQILAELFEVYNLDINTQKWSKLTDLQRFALLKLCRPGHENKNFPKALLEFGLICN